MVPGNLEQCLSEEASLIYFLSRRNYNVASRKILKNYLFPLQDKKHNVKQALIYVLFRKWRCSYLRCRDNEKSYIMYTRF